MATEIKRVPDFWDAATGKSDDVAVTLTKGATVTKGMLLLSGGAGKYTVASGTLALANISNRVAIALEDVTAASAGDVTIKAVKSGVVRIEEFYAASGFTSTTAPDYVLDEIGGKSNIIFVHAKEVE